MRRGRQKDHLAQIETQAQAIVNKAFAAADAAHAPVQLKETA
jgi:hypothetical protein